MHSIQTKFTLITVLAIVVAVLVSTAIGIAIVKDIVTEDSEQMLVLLCKTGEKRLDAYFGSVEQSVEVISSALKSRLDVIDMEDLGDHVERSKMIFADAVEKTNGVLTPPWKAL